MNRVYQRQLNISPGLSKLKPWLIGRCNEHIICHSVTIREETETWKVLFCTLESFQQARADVVWKNSHRQFFQKEFQETGHRINISIVNQVYFFSLIVFLLQFLNFIY